jgi:glucokinase
MGKLAVGVDFGGTKIAAGVVDIDSGRLVGTGRKKTRIVQEKEDIIKRIAAVIDESLTDAGITNQEIVGIGIGAAGMVNRQKGILLIGPNLGMRDVELAEPIAKLYSVPCRLGNDVEVATLGEFKFGAGRECRSFVCVFIGTGIGSGIIHDGKPYYGATQTAGEIGHIVLFPDGKQCGCGAFGCLEAYASRSAITKTIMADLQRGVESLVRDKIDAAKGTLRSKAIAQAIELGDSLVTSVVTQAAKYCGLGLASVINFYNPEKIILGGGVIEAVDLYFQVAVREARRQAIRPATRKLDIVKAELGDYAGIIGAALLVKSARL